MSRCTFQQISWYHRMQQLGFGICSGNWGSFAAEHIARFLQRSMVHLFHSHMEPCRKDRLKRTKNRVKNPSSQNLDFLTNFLARFNRFVHHWHPLTLEQSHFHQTVLELWRDMLSVDFPILDILNFSIKTLSFTAVFFGELFWARFRDFLRSKRIRIVAAVPEAELLSQLQAIENCFVVDGINQLKWWWSLWFPNPKQSKNFYLRQATEWTEKCKRFVSAFQLQMTMLLACLRLINLVSDRMCSVFANTHSSFPAKWIC